ncbi:MAG: 1-pyrroline-5-carboxylate dehydrogenase [Chloroflexi bacterium GWB2_49_20]|nr:MAG: 1-pyrroline-5-carboxylate dehydrogenase [Chloroflexi bacterium GWB2_49_20]OGN78652.1 MAG: 1-pyrroline-5-carboxylate dehydrogenase [Chloroflexi bacterium GWC2_49_37]OGN85754.1 MAG: 1-pyrroline-5-carboxylate dehydrogenase [Chloroflexi bacterium GWD2_49_16]HBG75016.1 1-pyrroline-5-carboxylate dehydrogenase [Anaerolineae bacterium]HCC78042.1 1-pyrroline-5-carboxylate dehydrogenase [Anaerolineae bacterium]
MSTFKLTYATMFNPPEELHKLYDQALTKVKANLGLDHGMLINGKDVFVPTKFSDHSPADTNLLLGTFQKGDAAYANLALSAARKAFPAWSRTKWQDRISLLRKAAEKIDDRLYEIGAALSLEVGKNRMEALGDIAETADLIRYSCDQMEKNNGFVVPMGKDPLVGYEARNVSQLRPYGVWLVISPFNFPFALTGGPAGAALVAGNTVVIKPATDTPWVVRLLVECFRDAGLPDGVVNYVTGPGNSLGQALIESPEVDGITFTGSYNVGMKIFRDFANGRYIRPTILELGGKNPVIVSRHADLNRAAIGIIRSAFGLQGQKCSAASRIFIEEPVFGDLIDRLKDLAEKLVIGDPTDRDVYLGPVINQNSYQEYKSFTSDLGKAGKFLTGGKVLTDGIYGKGYFCSPTFVTDLPMQHPLWKQEMFLPITTIAKVSSINEAMNYANDVEYGLTAGFYGSIEETDWFFDQIQAGVSYANRPQGATTGAWPGFQPFGGWKGSGSTGKNSGGHYYLLQYMHEQIHTLIR